MNRRGFVGSMAAFLGGLFCFGRRNPNSFRQFRIERDGVLLRGLRPMSEIRKGDRFWTGNRDDSRWYFTALRDPEPNENRVFCVPVRKTRKELSA